MESSRPEVCPAEGSGEGPLGWDFVQPWPGGRTGEPFDGGRVRIVWSPAGLRVRAELQDCRVMTAAAADGERLWELGDVLELFIGAEDRDAYLECHVAPNGRTLGLAWPSVAFLAAHRAAGRRDLDPVRIPAGAFGAFAGSTPTGWGAGFDLPAATLERWTGGRWDRGSVWRLSFGRYDYSAAGLPPVLSTTSPLTRIDFHRREEWRRVVLG